MIIDENLSFTDHVDSTENKLLYHNNLLRVRPLLAREQMLLYYRTRVNLIIQYGVLLYGSAPFSRYIELRENFFFQNVPIYNI